MATLEKQIEFYFVNRCKDFGITQRKFVSPGCVGVPDRIVLFPGGKTVFIEFKAPGKLPRATQIREHKILHGLGFEVYVVDNADQVDALLDLWGYSTYEAA